MDLLGDAGLERRGGQWQNLKPGERILGVSGYNCNMGYLAYGIELHTNLGRTLTYSSDHSAWRSSQFSWKAPENEEIEEVHFSNGRCTGISTVPCLNKLS